MNISSDQQIDEVTYIGSLFSARNFTSLAMPMGSWTNIDFIPCHNIPLE